MSRSRMLARGRPSQRNVVLRKQEYTVLERFDGYADNTPLENDTRWSVAAGDDSNGTTLKGVYSNGKGWFHDFDNLNNVEKIYTFATSSPGSGISKLKFSLDSIDDTDTLFEMIIANGGLNPILWLQIANANVRCVEPAVTPRNFLRNGSPIEGKGMHTYKVILNEDTEKFRLIFDGNEVFAETGFDDYYTGGAGAVIGFQIQTGTPNCLIDVYMDNLAVNW